MLKDDMNRITVKYVDLMIQTRIDHLERKIKIINKNRSGWDEEGAIDMLDAPMMVEHDLRMAKDTTMIECHLKEIQFYQELLNI